MGNYIDIFKAIGDETRVRILSLLILSQKSICVCEIVDSLEEPQYNVSRHLKVLKYAGLIGENRKGRWKYYSLTKKKNLFLTHLFKTISTIPEEIISKDYMRLKKCLKARKERICV